MAVIEAKPEPLGFTITITTLPDGHHVTLFVGKRAFHSADTYINLAAAEMAARHARANFRVREFQDSGGGIR